jgi:hypothetical protein
MFGKKSLFVALTVIGIFAAQALGVLYLIQQFGQMIHGAYAAMATSFEDAVMSFIYNGRNVLTASF